MARILRGNELNLELCKKELEKSKVIALPTETVYGLAGNALDEAAINLIFKIKGRPLFNPLIVHTNSVENARKLGHFNELATKLTKKYWPGPLTVVLPKKDIVPNLVTADLDSVALRCPNDETFLNLLNKIPFPLAAPSANPFGYVSPTCAEHVDISLGNKIDFILDGSKCEIGLESTIIDLRDETSPIILRLGPITKNELEDFTNVKFRLSNKKTSNQLRAPGMLKSHYSPSTPIEKISLTKMLKLINTKKCNENAFIFQRTHKDKISIKAPNIFCLSEKGNSAEIAHNFYELLRKADGLRYAKIYIEEVTDNNGINAAINDRLSRAISST